MQEEMYLLQEEYWHDVDGSFTVAIDIYRDKAQAQLAASLLNDEQGYKKRYSSLEFNVVTYKVK